MIDSFLGRQWALCWPSGVTMEHMPHLRADGYLSVALCMHASQYECPQKRRRGRRMVLKALPQSWQHVAARSSPPAVSSPSRTTAPLSASELTRSGGARLSLCEYPDELRSKSRCSGSPTCPLVRLFPLTPLRYPLLALPEELPRETLLSARGVPSELECRSKAPAVVLMLLPKEEEVPLASPGLWQASLPSSSLRAGCTAILATAGECKNGR